MTAIGPMTRISRRWTRTRRRRSRPRRIGLMRLRRHSRRLASGTCDRPVPRGERSRPRTSRGPLGRIRRRNTSRVGRSRPSPSSSTAPLRLFLPMSIPTGLPSGTGSRAPRILGDPGSVGSSAAEDRSPVAGSNPAGGYAGGTRPGAALEGEPGASTSAPDRTRRGLLPTLDGHPGTEVGPGRNGRPLGRFGSRRDVPAERRMAGGMARPRGEFRRRNGSVGV